MAKTSRAGALIALPTRGSGNFEETGKARGVAIMARTIAVPAGWPLGNFRIFTQPEGGNEEDLDAFVPGYTFTAVHQDNSNLGTWRVYGRADGEDVMTPEDADEGAFAPLKTDAEALADYQAAVAKNQQIWHELGFVPGEPAAAADGDEATGAPDGEAGAEGTEGNADAQATATEVAPDGAGTDEGAEGNDEAGEPSVEGDADAAEGDEPNAETAVPSEANGPRHARGTRRN